MTNPEKTAHQAGDAQELADLVDKQRFAMFTTLAPGGTLLSRPMTVQERVGWTLRFIAQADNAVTQQAEGQQVNLAFAAGNTYISLSGTCRVERDVALKQELWNRLNEAYAGEPEDPNNIVLEVMVSSGEYWDGGNPVSDLFGLAKAVITGQAPTGEHGTVQL